MLSEPPAAGKLHLFGSWPRYCMDTYQKTYFVIDSYEQLMEATRPDFTPIYARLAQQESIPAVSVLDTDTVFQRGSGEG